MKRISLYFFYVMLFMAVSTSVFAESTPLDRAQRMVRQLNAQKVRLEQQNVQLKKDMDKLNKETAKQVKKQKAGNKKLDQANKNKGVRIQKLHNKLKETIIALRKSESERLNANQIGAILDVDLKRCVKNNHELVDMNDELVGKYQNKGVWDSFAQFEPFTGIKQVEVENVMQEYRFNNEDLEVNPEIEYQPSGGMVSSAPDKDDTGS